MLKRPMYRGENGENFESVLLDFTKTLFHINNHVVMLPFLIFFAYLTCLGTIHLLNERSLEQTRFS